jgi:hypothetical protein
MTPEELNEGFERLRAHVRAAHGSEHEDTKDYLEEWLYEHALELLRGVAERSQSLGGLIAAVVERH